MEDFKVPFAAYSALFRAVKNSMFINDKLSNRIVWLNNNKDGKIQIFNRKRIKSILFEEIKSLYNNRINSHELNLTRLSETDINNFSIETFFIIEDEDSSSGLYEIFPKTFRCDKCDDLRIFSAGEWENFDVNKCRVPGCNGTYTQVPFIGFCETCGEITNIFHNCEEHGHEYLQLVRKDINAPATWKIRCRKCGREMDMMNFCNHKNFTLSNKDLKKLKPINVNQGGIFRSIVKTTIDIPEFEESENIDIILFGIYINYWDKYFDDDEELTEEDIIEDIIVYLNKLEEYPTEKERKKAIRRGFATERTFEIGEQINKDIVELKDRYPFNYSDLNDYFILKQRFSSDEENKNLNYEDIVKDDKNLLNKYNKFKKDIGIEDVTYIPDIHMISSSIGVIKGINSEDKPPHFEPHWKNSSEKDKFQTFSYPFETEGILFDLDKEKLVDWILSNSDNPINEYESAEEYLFNLDETSKEYENLKTLIHTFAHILISRSSLYTGLNSDSCGELLFPKAGSFLIYSTSNINIGGFSFVFENSLLKWFNNVKLEIRDCVFDPTCIDEKGACFSCVYLPEFVCSHFNDFLDRDVFLGEVRFKKGYWKY